MDSTKAKDAGGVEGLVSWVTGTVLIFGGNHIVARLGQDGVSLAWWVGVLLSAAWTGYVFRGMRDQAMTRHRGEQRP